MPRQPLPDPADDEDSGGARKRSQLDPVPNVTVLGNMDGNIAVRLGWKHGMHVFSNSRFKFMREELDLNVTDDPDDYLF